MIPPLHLPKVWSTLLLAGLAAAQRSPDEALATLVEGNRRFAAGNSRTPPTGDGVRRALARGQSPVAVVVCCSDSRVPPEHLFQLGLGELIVVRTAGHVVDAEGIAAIERAVEQLGVPLCVVLGHEQCDIVAQALATCSGAASAATPAQQRLLERLEPAVRKALDRDLGGKELQTYGEEEHAQATAHECLSRSELLRSYQQAGRFRIVAARCQLPGGEIDWLPVRPLQSRPAAGWQAPAGAVPMGVPPHVALRLLQSGHRRFLSDRRPTPDLTAERRAALVDGQQPTAVVLTCSDSRVVPEHLFDAGLGELVVVRVPGNAPTDEALATIEHAAGRLGAALLLVLGHSGCDELTAAADQPEHRQLTHNQRALLRRLEPPLALARQLAAAGEPDAAARANALRTLHELRAQSSLLRDLEATGRFAMLAAVYQLPTGDLEWLKDSDEPPASARQLAGGEPLHDPGRKPAAPAAEVAHPQPAARTADRHAPRNPGDAAHAAPDQPTAVEPAGERSWRRVNWQDPVVLIGLAGVGSLLAAGLLALRRR